MNFFSFNFALREYFFVLRPPPPPISFLMVRPLGLASSTKKNQQDNISVQRGRDVYLSDGQRHQKCEKVISHPYLMVQRLSGSEKKNIISFP